MIFCKVQKMFYDEMDKLNKIKYFEEIDLKKLDQQIDALSKSLQSDLKNDENDNNIDDNDNKQKHNLMNNAELNHNNDNNNNNNNNNSNDDDTQSIQSDTYEYQLPLKKNININKLNDNLIIDKMINDQQSQSQCNQNNKINDNKNNDSKININNNDHNVNMNKNNNDIDNDINMKIKLIDSKKEITVKPKVNTINNQNDDNDDNDIEMNKKQTNNNGNNNNNNTMNKKINKNGHLNNDVLMKSRDGSIDVDAAKALLKQIQNLQNQNVENINNSNINHIKNNNHRKSVNIALPPIKKAIYNKNNISSSKSSSSLLNNLNLSMLDSKFISQIASVNHIDQFNFIKSKKNIIPNPPNNRKLSLVNKTASNLNQNKKPNNHNKMQKAAPTIKPTTPSNLKSNYIPPTVSRVNITPTLSLTRPKAIKSKTSKANPANIPPTFHSNTPVRDVSVRTTSENIPARCNSVQAIEVIIDDDPKTLNTPNNTTTKSVVRKTTNNNNNNNNNQNRGKINDVTNSLNVTCTINPIAHSVEVESSPNNNNNNNNHQVNSILSALNSTPKSVNKKEKTDEPNDVILIGCNTKNKNRKINKNKNINKTKSMTPNSSSPINHLSQNKNRSIAPPNTSSILAPNALEQLQQMLPANILNDINNAINYALPNYQNNQNIANHQNNYSKFVNGLQNSNLLTNNNNHININNIINVNPNPIINDKNKQQEHKKQVMNIDINDEEFDSHCDSMSDNDDNASYINEEDKRKDESEINESEINESEIKKTNIKPKQQQRRTLKWRKCPYCSYKTKYAGNLPRHVRRHIMPTTKTFVDNVNNKESKSIDIIKIDHHTMDENEMSELWDTDEPKDKIKGDKYKCDQSHCSFTTNYKHSINNHRAIHESEKYKCEHCKLTYSSQKRLRNHIWNIHYTEMNAKRKLCESKNQCFLCKSEFKSNKGLLDHYQDNHKLEWKEELRNTQKKSKKGHIDNDPEKRFKCPHCPKRFKARNAMNGHIANIHTPDSEKKYKCDECGKKFGQRCIMIMHINRIHDAEKKFECDHCSKRFRLKSEWKRHIKSYHNDNDSDLNKYDNQY